MKNIKINNILRTRINTNILLLVSCIFLLTSCGEKKTEETHEEEKSETEVALTEAQFKTIGIETGSIKLTR